MISKQIMVRVDNDLDKRIESLLESKKRSEYRTRSDLLREALQLGLAIIAERQ